MTFAPNTIEARTAHRPLRDRQVPVIAVAVLLLLVAPALFAQSAAPATQPVRADPDARLDPLQPDFTLAALPTTLRVPRNRWGFRVTHRFTRPLGRGNVGDLAADLFGLDSSAQVGLEVRYGLARGLQIGVHRTSDRTIQLFAQHSILSERHDRPLGLDALVTLEGWNNLQEHRRSTVGLLLSRTALGRATLYAQPLVVLNSNPFDVGDDHTVMVGLGTRLRLTSAGYLVAEITPRVAGFDPNVHQMSFALERRVGGHAFQLNFSNGFGTTLGQLAHGGLGYDDWFIGFNISRKFF